MGSDEEGGLFDETITAYKKQKKRAKILIVETIKYAFPTSLRSYINKPQWLTIAEDSEAGELGISLYSHEYFLLMMLMMLTQILL